MELMTAKEAAEALKVHEQTIYRYCQEGKLTEFRGPDGKGPLRLSKTEVENFFRPKPAS